MSNSHSEPTDEGADDIAEADAEDHAASGSPHHPSPAVSAGSSMRFDPGSATFSDVLQSSPHPRWIDSSHAKLIEGHAITVQDPVPHHPRLLASGAAEAVAAAGIDPVIRPLPLPPRPEPTSARDDSPKPSFWRSHARKAAVLAVVAGLCGAAGSFARIGHADSPDAAEIAAKASAAKAAEAEAKQSEATKQIAQMAMDMRLMSAKVETLRAEIERTRYSDDARALKKSVDALRSGLDHSKSETAMALGQMAQKLDRLQREPSAPKLTQIAERLERMERRTAVSNDVTGSISRSPSTTVAVATPLPIAKPAGLSHTTSKPSEPSATPVRTAGLPGPKTVSESEETTAAPEPKPQPKIIPGLVLRDVQGGVAIVEGRGGIFGIARGDFIPGVGRIEGIERHGREMVVVTSRGLITSHYQR